MFKVKNKTERHYFTNFSSVYTINFEQVNVSWDSSGIVHVRVARDYGISQDFRDKSGILRESGRS